jgi:hypothetical protein
MDPTDLVFSQLLTLAGLIGGTIEYCEIIKRREATRQRVEQDRLTMQSVGLQGLVRVLLADRS